MEYYLHCPYHAMILPTKKCFSHVTKCAKRPCAIYFACKQCAFKTFDWQSVHNHIQLFHKKKNKLTTSSKHKDAETDNDSVSDHEDNRSESFLHENNIIHDLEDSGVLDLSTGQASKGEELLKTFDELLKDSNDFLQTTLLRKLLERGSSH